MSELASLLVGGLTFSTAAGVVALPFVIAALIGNRLGGSARDAAAWGTKPIVVEADDAAFRSAVLHHSEPQKPPAGVRRVVTTAIALGQLHIAVGIYVWAAVFLRATAGDEIFCVTYAGALMASGALLHEASVRFATRQPFVPARAATLHVALVVVILLSGIYALGDHPLVFVLSAFSSLAWLSLLAMELSPHKAQAPQPPAAPRIALDD